MKKINPVGRIVENNLSANFEAVPYACQCSDWNAYTGARGKSHDDCEHCGCQCDKLSHKLGNRNGAKNTDRASKY